MVPNVKCAVITGPPLSLPVDMHDRYNLRMHLAHSNLERNRLQWVNPVLRPWEVALLKRQDRGKEALARAKCVNEVIACLDRCMNYGRLVDRNPVLLESAVEFMALIIFESAPNFANDAPPPCRRITAVRRARTRLAHRGSDEIRRENTTVPALTPVPNSQHQIKSKECDVVVHKEQ